MGTESRLRWAWNCLKLNVTSSNVFSIIIHWLSARRDVGLTQGSLIPEEHSLYRALKHSIRQHKLNLNLSKTKQSLPIITNSHLNFRYLTTSAEQKLKIDLRHTWLNTALQLVEKRNFILLASPKKQTNRKNFGRDTATAVANYSWPGY